MNYQITLNLIICFHRLNLASVVYSTETHIDATTSNSCSDRRRSPNSRSGFQRPHHTISSTTTLASHWRPYRVQNLHPHVSYPFWNLPLIYDIHGRAMLCFKS